MSASVAILSAGPVPERVVFDSPAHGAEIQFRGVVRGLEAGRPIRGIDYSAYVPMAERLLLTIAEQAVAAEPAARVFIQHSLGFVPAGQASVLIAVAMSHSAEAFRLAQEVLRHLKTGVPIWKRPVWADEVMQPVIGT